MTSRKANNSTDSLVKSRKKVKKPDLYKVIMLNDDFTTMDFVVDILINIFGKNMFEATDIMLTIHQKGRGVAGIYTFDIAKSKITQVEQRASAEKFPLKCIMERA